MYLEVLDSQCYKKKCFWCCSTPGTAFTKWLNYRKISIYFKYFNQYSLNRNERKNPERY